MVRSTERVRKTIGAVILSARKKKGMTQKELADALGTVGTAAAISSWERGRNAPSEEDLALLSAILEVPIDDFYKGEAITYHYYGISPDDPDPDEDLAMIVETYRAVNDEGKKYLRDAAAFALGREMFRS